MDDPVDRIWTTTSASDATLTGDGGGDTSPALAESGTTSAVGRSAGAQDPSRSDADTATASHTPSRLS